ncbi:MAG: hypothetical protein WCT42_04225 [Candidatus Paceibacterota bacterium]
MDIKLNFKSKILIILAIIVFLFLIIFSVIFFYQKNKKITEENIIQAENKFVESGFDKFYKKENDEFCVEETDKQKQEDIFRDMLWTLELEGDNYRKIEKIKCKNSQDGIKIK